MTERNRGKRWNGANMKRKKLGSVSLDLVPGPDNPRNSEGAFLTLENGEILYAYSRYKGDSQADEATADLCLLRSGDDGRTFGEESIILTCEGEGGVNAMSLSLMHMKNGDIGLFLSGKDDLYTAADVPASFPGWRKNLGRTGAVYAAGGLFRGK